MRSEGISMTKNPKNLFKSKITKIIKKYFGIRRKPFEA